MGWGRFSGVPRRGFWSEPRCGPLVRPGRRLKKPSAFLTPPFVQLAKREWSSGADEVVAREAKREPRAQVRCPG